MSTTPVPRLVGATWYAVPCPEGVPLTLGFPSGEACGAFCEGMALGPERDFDAELQVAADEGYDVGYDAGYESGWDVGRDDGLNEARKDCLARKCVARSAESA